MGRCSRTVVVALFVGLVVVGAPLATAADAADATVQVEDGPVTLTKVGDRLVALVRVSNPTAEPVTVSAESFDEDGAALCSVKPPSQDIDRSSDLVTKWTLDKSCVGNKTPVLRFMVPGATPTTV